MALVDLAVELSWGSWFVDAADTLAAVVLGPQAEHPLLEGNHEPLPERVTELAGYGVHHSHGEHAPELPRPHLSL